MLRSCHDQRTTLRAILYIEGIVLSLQESFTNPSSGTFLLTDNTFPIQSCGVCLWAHNTIAAARIYAVSGIQMKHLQDNSAGTEA